MNVNRCALRGAKFSWSYAIPLLCMAFSIPAMVKGQELRKNDLKEVKVKGTTATRQSQMPSQKVTLTDFRRYAADNVADAIRNLSGVNIKDYGGIGGLKTVSVRSLGANHTGIFYDGIQMNDAQNGQVDLGKLSLNNLQEITLFNGQPDLPVLPARAYANASTLLLTPLNPQVDSLKPFRLTAAIKAGSFGLIEPMLQWEQRIDNRWSYKVNAFHTYANGRYKYKVEGDGSTEKVTRKNSDIGALQTDAAVYYLGQDSSSFDVQLNYYKSERGLPGAVVFYNDYSAQRLWNEDLFLQAKYNRKWKNSFQLLVNTKVSQSYIRYLDPDYLNTAGELDQRYKQKEYYLSAAVAYSPLAGLNLSYVSDAAINQLNTNLYQYTYPTRITLLQVMAAKYSVGRSVFQGNLLHTYIKETTTSGQAAPSRSILSPTLQYAYTPFENSGLRLRAFYKNIFRNPTFNDLYYSRIGTVDLKPEYVKQYNVGITYANTYKGKLSYLSLTADAYYNAVKDKIIAVPNKDIFSWSMRNLGKVDIRGLDLSAKTKYQLNPHWAALFSANYTYQNAVDVTSSSSSVYLDQIPYTPQHTANLNAGVAGDHFEVYLNHSFSSHRYYLSENLPQYKVPGFSVTDLSINRHLKFAAMPVTATFEINNLLNSQYAFIRSFPMPGRSFRITLKIII